MADELKPIIEALIFASPEPLTLKALYEPARLRAERRRGSGSSVAQAGLRPAQRPAARGGGRRPPDCHASGAPRLGASALRRTENPSPQCAGARDSGRHRLQAAGHRAGNHGDSWRQYGWRSHHTPRAATHSYRREEARRRPSVFYATSGSSWCASASIIWVTCRRSRRWPTLSASRHPLASPLVRTCSNNRCSTPPRKIHKAPKRFTERSSPRLRRRL